MIYCVGLMMLFNSICMLKDFRTLGIAEYTNTFKSFKINYRFFKRGFNRFRFIGLELSLRQSCKTKASLGWDQACNGGSGGSCIIWQTYSRFPVGRDYSNCIQNGLIAGKLWWIVPLGLGLPRYQTWSFPLILQSKRIGKYSKQKIIINSVEPLYIA